MNRKCSRLTFCWTALWLAVAPAVAPAQDADLQQDPAVAAALEANRDTPMAQMRAALTLMDLNRPELAAEIFAELTAANLSDEQRAELVAHFGTARFTKLLRETTPRGDQPSRVPGAAEFARSCLDAAAARARDPRRLAQAAQAVADGDVSAQRTLLAGGEAAIAPIVSALAKTKSDAARARLMTTLVALHPTVDRPLVALLAEARGRLRRDAAEVAGRLRLFDALPWLAVMSVGDDPATAGAAQAALDAFHLPQPSPGEAVELVRRELAKLAKRDAATRTGGAGQSSWWTWDASEQQLTKQVMTPRRQRILRLARLARAPAEAGLAAAPVDRSTELLYGWEEAAALDRPVNDKLAKRAAALSADELSDLLALAMHDHLYAAAIRTTELLAQQNDLGVLTSHDGQPAPLAAALDSPHDGLRFAALEAVLALAPPTSFAGASYVPETLWYFASGAGDPTAVAAAATIPRANSWAGQLRSLGYDAVAATTGRGALQAALDRTRAARLALVAVDSDISLPRVYETVFQLRRRTATAETPIAILCSLPRLEEIKRLAADDPLLLVEPRPHGEGAMAGVVERLMALGNPQPASEEVRVARAKFALTAIADMLASDAPYDELARDAALLNATLFHPTLSAASIDVLAQLGTSASQQALANYANSAALPIEVRQQAAEAFAANVARFGIQLTPGEINRQYERYNASATADAQTQALLSGILDVIEGK